MTRPAVVDKDPTPEPSSTVKASSASRRAYFTGPTAEMLALEAATGAAYEEARTLYGDEDGDAWLAALEDGTHPLCRIKSADQPLG